MSVYKFKLPDVGEGMAEGTNQTLPGMTRCLLLEAKLPNWYWPDAILHACYIKNRIPHSAHKKTPYELFYKKSPDLDIIPIFGEPIWVLNQDPKR